MSDEYYPFTQNNTINEEKVVLFMLRLGFVYDRSISEWFVLNYDGLFYRTTEEFVKIEIMRFLDKRAPSGVNIPLKNVDGIYSRLKACSFDRSCSRKYENFIINHDEYEIPYGFDGCEFMPNHLIPVRNGLINPATMELLPHCAYLLHHNVYNFNYRKLSEDEILNCPERDTYARIIPDKETLDLFLWWVGMVLFSQDLPRVLMLFYGPGGTGKSTLWKGLSEILTPAKCMSPNLNAFKNSRFIAGNFEDKQLVVFDEMSNTNGLLDDSLFKQLTGGVSNFIIEKKYQQPRTVSLTAKFLLIGNSYPQFIQDTAIYDRLFIIECAIRQEKDIRDYVIEEDHLNWLFNAGYYYYVTKHPQTSVKYLSQLRTPKMLFDLDRYRDTDAFIYWIKEYLSMDTVDIDTIRKGLDRHSSKEVYNNYRDCVLDEGGKPLSAIRFNVKLREEYGLEKTVINGIDGQYRGYRIIPEK